MAENGDHDLVIAVAIANVGHAAVKRNQAAVANRDQPRAFQQWIPGQIAFQFFQTRRRHDPLPDAILVAEDDASVRVDLHLRGIEHGRPVAAIGEAAHAVLDQISVRRSRARSRNKQKRECGDDHDAAHGQSVSRRFVIKRHAR